MSLLQTVALVLPSLINSLIPPPAPGESNLGYVILVLFLSPVAILIGGAILGKPRDSKLISILIGTIGLFAIGFVVVVFVLSFVVSFFY
jgi:hypothetical protein